MWYSQEHYHPREVDLEAICHVHVAAKMQQHQLWFHSKCPALHPNHILYMSQVYGTPTERMHIFDFSAAIFGLQLHSATKEFFLRNRKQRQNEAVLAILSVILEEKEAC